MIKHDSWNQKLAHQDIAWAADASQAAAPSVRSGRCQGIPSGAPASVPAGGTTPDVLHPYWEFDWELTHTGGIRISNLVVRDSVSIGSTEPVAKSIDFTDLSVGFEGTQSLEDFDVASAFGDPESAFEMKYDGHWRDAPAEHVFQYGLMLTLVHQFGGRCHVTLRIGVVFGGSANDFDPGGIPVALKIYPQLGFTWRPSSGSPQRRVRQFRGSVRVVVNNYMTPAVVALMHAAGHPPGFTPDPGPAQSNIVSLFADTNQLLLLERRLLSDLYGRSLGAAAGGVANRLTGLVSSFKPFGWSSVFDYTRSNLQTEVEHLMVEPASLAEKKPRSNSYRWASGLNVNLTLRQSGFLIEKVPRQRAYDNVHLHGRMPMKDDRGNVQLHAPFCGHSCVHMHWRWSCVSSEHAEGGREDQFKGWSSGLHSQAHAEPGAPLIPPNQRLRVAICNEATSRHDANTILAPGQANALAALEKMIWYCVDVLPPDPGVLVPPKEQQVVMPHGLGWAYRYSWDEPNSATDDLDDVFFDNLPMWWSPSPSRSQVARFFEEKVYPTFRYISPLLGANIAQVPEGNTANPDVAGPPPESL